MRWGSMFAGLGGLDLACEWAFPGSRTAWQLDQVLAGVRRRHWPDALQVEADVRTVDPLDLPRIDGMLGGFPCTDLSVAGKQAGLDGEKSGLYGEMLRFARALRPEVVVIENVPALLGYRERLEDDWSALGYGLTWVKAQALDAGAPHIRRRVFVVARMGAGMGGVIEAPTGGAWTPDADGLRTWPTTTTTDVKASGSEGYSTDSGRHPGVTLTDAVRPWATLTASEDKGRRVSLARRENPDMLSEQVRAWATPKTSDAASPGSASGGGARQGSDGLACEVRAWPTPVSRDYKSGNAVVPQQGALAIRTALRGPIQQTLFNMEATA